MLLVLLLAAPAIWNQPIVGAVTESTAVVLVGLDTVPGGPIDSCVTEYGLTTSYGAVSDTGVGQFPRMNLINLTPDTIYHYMTIAFNGVNADSSADRCFKTQDTSGTFTFVIIGDPQPDVTGEGQIYETVTDSLWNQIRKEHADFVLVNGDNTDIRGYFQGDWDNVRLSIADSCWHGWHTHIDTLLDSVMVCCAVGNHETFSVYENMWAIDTILIAYNNGCVSYPTGNDSGYYSFRWGDCFIIVANSCWLYESPERNKFGPTQMGWLTDILADTLINNSFNWSFMFFHHPFFDGHNVDGYWYIGTSTDRDSLITMMKNCRLDAVVNSHHHSWDNIDIPNFTRSLVTGGGGGPLNAGYPYDILDFHYLRVEVHPESVRIYAKDEFGDTLDTVLWVHESKAANSINLSGAKF